MIPQRLIDKGKWCVWRYEYFNEKGNRLDKPKKIPINPTTGHKAQSNNSKTFTSFEIANNAKEKHDGIGIGIFGNVGAIDIDNCILDGKLSAMAQDIIDSMNTYTEISPSKKGLRLLFEISNFNYDKQKYYINNTNLGLEVYISGATNKYLTVTGNQINNNEFRDCSDLLEQVLDKYMLRNLQPNKASKNGICILPIEQILRKAFDSKNGAEIKALFEGNISKYKSQSEADLALCSYLAFWCNRDFMAIDKLLRQSALYREDKWNSKRGSSTYGEITINKAVSSCKDVYSPKASAEREFELPYIYKNRNGADVINIPALREYIKQNNIIKFHQGSFRIYESGYYKQFDMRSYVYMQMPKHLRSNKIAEQVTLDLQLDMDLLLNDTDLAKEQYICFKNGVYNIETMEFTKHSSELIFISQIPHNYNPNAMADDITESFLQNCCGTDNKQRKLLLEIIGVTLSDVRCFNEH